MGNLLKGSIVEIEKQILLKIKESRGLPPGDAKVNMLHDVCKLAASHQMEQLEYFSKKEFTTAAIQSGATDKILIFFPWLIAYADKNPERVSRLEIMWMNEWAVMTLLYYPQIPLNQVLKAFEDLQQRLKEIGITNRRLYELQRLVFLTLGDLDKAVDAHDRFLNEPKSTGKPNGITQSNAAMETYGHGFFLEKIGRVDAARQILRPVLSGYARDTDLRTMAQALMLVPLTTLGETELAAKYCLQAWHRLELLAVNVPMLADIIAFLVKSDNVDRAFNVYDQISMMGEEMKDNLEKVNFYSGAAYLMERMKGAGKQTIKVQLPSTHALWNAEGEYELEALHANYISRMKELLDRINSRNGNDYQSRYQEMVNGWREGVTPHRFKGPANE